MAVKKKKAVPAKAAVPPKPKRKVGRPTDYKKEYAALATKFCLLGATDAQLAEFFEVEESTINNWKLKHPEFLEAIKDGKERADAEIAHSLYHRAKGYEHDAEEIKVVSGGGNSGSHVERVAVRKIYPPDTKAITMWLTNRRRAAATPQAAVWSERQEIDHTSKGEQLAAPFVYLPQDLPRNIVPEAPPATP